MCLDTDLFNQHQVPTLAVCLSGQWAISMGPARRRQWGRRVPRELEIANKALCHTLVTSLPQTDDWIDS